MYSLDNKVILFVIIGPLFHLDQQLSEEIFDPYLINALFKS